MCGRFSLSNTTDIYRRFSLKPPLLFKHNDNCSPGQILPVITFNNSYQFNLFRWGITPYWNSLNSRNLINIRYETLVQKNTFKEYFASNRCLVPANGFYEWAQKNGKKTPYYFTPVSSSFFTFAGLYNNDSFAIITTPANEVVSPIHSRMPLILDQKSQDLWLDLETPSDRLVNLLFLNPSVNIHCQS